MEWTSLDSGLDEFDGDEVSESSVTSATCLLVMSLRQAVTSHLEEGVFFTNEALRCVGTCYVSAWFCGFLPIFSYLKQVRWQIPNPTYWIYIPLWEEKG